MKFRKKPVVIEAVQFTGKNQREALSFVYPNLSKVALSGAEIMGLPVVISTLEGDMTANPGDWIIKGVKGEFYPCKPDIFEATYEPVPAAPDFAGSNLDAIDEAAKDLPDTPPVGWSPLATDRAPEKPEGNTNAH